MKAKTTFFWCEPNDPKQTPCVFDERSYNKMEARATMYVRCIRHGALILGDGQFESRKAAQKFVRGED